MVRGGLGANDVGNCIFRERYCGTPKVQVSMVPNEQARVDADDLSDSAAIDNHTKTDAIRVALRGRRRGQEFHPQR